VILAEVRADVAQVLEAEARIDRGDEELPGQLTRLFGSESDVGGSRAELDFDVPLGDHVDPLAVAAAIVRIGSRLFGSGISRVGSTLFCMVSSILGKVLI